jgi:hypothetical protein
MSDPEPDSGECDGGKEVPGELVIAGGDSSEVFELVEEALDEVALPVDRGIDRALDLAVPLGRDVRVGAMGGDEIDDGTRVVAAVGDGVLGRGEIGEQRRHGGLVGGLARAEHEAQRQAPAIDDDVDLGAQSASRSSDGVIRPPLFPPAAC